MKRMFAKYLGLFLHHLMWRPASTFCQWLTRLMVALEKIEDPRMKIQDYLLEGHDDNPFECDEGVDCEGCEKCDECYQ